ncbi:MAG: DUF2752 domain-containing protein [Actinomycetales bacterium]|nr:DUF2752 domain-containing protein [Actinomycetales bacterium]
MLTRDDAGPVQPELAPIVDPRPRWRRLIAPIAAASGIIAATLLIRFVDPHEPGIYPACPTKALLGIDCPACGGLRATNCLANGDIAGAFDHNALFVICVPIIIIGWGVWMYRAWTGRHPAPTPTRAAIARVAPVVLILAATTFAVVRHFVPYLGSGVG